MNPESAKLLLSSGLMSFPITDFKEDGTFDPDGYSARLEWLMPYGASALFAAGGTGEAFSLAPSEHEQVVRRAVEVCGTRTPIIASACYGTAMAMEMAKAAERSGATAILLLPHYLTDAPEEGVLAHIEQVCRSVGLGVIVYQRNVCRVSADGLAKLAERCPNLIGFKDGLGDIELMVAIRQRLGDRLAYLGGLPTAEVYAEAYRALGVPVYSSAVFNFIPATAKAFYEAVVIQDSVKTAALLNSFFLPFLKIRNGTPGYAVSIIKAGARLVGRSAGRVRPPLVDLQPEEEAVLAKLIEVAGPQ